MSRITTRSGGGVRSGCERSRGVAMSPEAAARSTAAAERSAPLGAAKSSEFPRRGFSPHPASTKGISRSDRRISVLLLSQRNPGEGIEAGAGIHVDAAAVERDVRRADQVEARAGRTTAEEAALAQHLDGSAGSERYSIVEREV